MVGLLDGQVVNKRVSSQNITSIETMYLNFSIR